MMIFLEFILYETIQEYLEKFKTSENNLHRKMIEERFTVSVKVGYKKQICLEFVSKYLTIINSGYLIPY